jgi:hypothetical protein
MLVRCAASLRSAWRRKAKSSREPLLKKEEKRERRNRTAQKKERRCNNTRDNLGLTKAILQIRTQKGNFHLRRKWCFMECEYKFIDRVTITPQDLAHVSHVPLIPFCMRRDVELRRGSPAVSFAYLATQVGSPPSPPDPYRGNFPELLPHFLALSLPVPAFHFHACWRTPRS